MYSSFVGTFSLVGSSSGSLSSKHTKVYFSLSADFRQRPLREQYIHIPKPGLNIFYNHSSIEIENYYVGSEL